VKRITDTSWDPFPIFDTLSRPIYEEPAIIYVAKRKQFAVAFGTGDRENLWNLDGQVGRFYVAVDDNFTASMVASGQLPKTEASYQAIDVTATNVSSTSDFLSSPGTGKSPGWFLKLQANERVITQSFGLTGILIFSGFQPQDVGSDPQNVCARGGVSHLYVVSTTNANSLLNVGGSSTRFLVVPKFVTNPYVEQGSTKGSGSSGGSGSGGSGSGSNSEQPDPTLDAVTQQLKSLLAPQCKFGNVHLSVSTITSETGHVSIARVPVCTILHNWKEQ
jgi:hypothetical protein